jgi:hypothetical protein
MISNMTRLHCLARPHTTLSGLDPTPLPVQGVPIERSSVPVRTMFKRHSTLDDLISAAVASEVSCRHEFISFLIFIIILRLDCSPDLAQRIELPDRFLSDQQVRSPFMKHISN